MKTFILLAIGASLFTSCARDLSSDVYSSYQVGEVSSTYPGVVVSVREVRVDNGEFDNSGLGLVGGGVAGGVIGNAVGRGDLVPTAAGAIVGAVAGSLIESKARQQMALEYTVELDNGDLVTLVQGLDCVLGIGQPVFLVVGQAGRSRLTPQY